MACDVSLDRFSAGAHGEPALTESRLRQTGGQVVKIEGHFGHFAHRQREGRLMCMHCTRRHFLEASAASGMALAAGHLAAESTAPSPPASSHSKVRICAIIAGKPADRSWGLSEADVTPMIKRLAAEETHLRH